MILMEIYERCVLYGFRITRCPKVDSLQLTNRSRRWKRLYINSYSFFKPNFGEQY